MDSQFIRYVLDGAAGAARRFPLAAAFCAGTCAMTWWLIGGPQPEPHLRLTLAITLGLGAALFYALALVAERFPLPAPARPWHLFAAGGLFLVYFYYLFAGGEGLDYGDRFAQWAFFVITLAMAAPYLRAAEPLGMWQFVRRLVLRYAVSAVYTVALFAGISLALAAVDKLFGVHIDESAYQYLWAFAATLFWPLHFMAGTPQHHDALAADATYPRGLKLFTQYVLLPLASLYFLILYVYMAKILATQQWPQGWVSWLTSSASALGLLAFLLLYPVSGEPENRRIRVFSRGFCLAALPLLLMLFTALYKRVAQYGLTEHRYFMIGFGLWLFGMFLYFLLSRRPDIRRVPTSLALLAAVTSFGPWSAYSVGLSSQLGRFERLLADNGLLAAGKAVKLEGPLPDEARRGLSGALDYILRYHGPDPLKAYFPPDHPALSRATPGRRYDASKALMAYMGQEYLNHWAQGASTNLNIRAERSGMDVAGYDLAVRFNAYADRAAAPAEDEVYRVQLRREERELRVFRDGRFLIDVPLGPLLAATSAVTRETGRVEQDLLKAEAANGAVKVRVYLSALFVERKRPEAPEALTAEGLLLLKHKK